MNKDIERRLARIEAKIPPGQSKTAVADPRFLEFLKAANATVTLGPGTLRSKVDLTTGAATASLKLPPATGSFKELGVVPVTATVASLGRSAMVASRT